MSETDADVRRFMEAVKAASERMLAGNAQELARLGGVNVRINLRKSFEAAGKGVAFGIAVAKIYASGQVHLEDVGGIAAGFGLWSTFLDAIREKMTPLQYVACCAIGQSEDGCA